MKPPSRHPLSVAGALLATLGALLFLIVFFLDLLGLHTNPYMGIVFFIVLPSIFVIGLILIPLGMWRDRKRRLAGRTGPFEWPSFDLNNPHQRRVTVMVIVLTFVNIVIISLAAYSGVEYMDSPTFCGQVCHSVMTPEFTAHQISPHARVTCVQCHIGPGAGFFVKSKLDGLRQVVAVTFGTYSKPIHSPVHTLRPARVVCEQCHWPEKFHGDVVRTIYDYADDAANTESKTVLDVHVGGGADRFGNAAGIHWHMNIANKIEYIATDDKRQVIPWVRLTNRDGKVEEYKVEGVTSDQLEKGEQRTMDCVDCHNRPAHPFDPTPEKAVNRAMGDGEIPKTLPYIKREATAALKVTYPSQEAAMDGIAVKLREFYRTEASGVYMSRRQDVERAVSATQQLYRHNLFPGMNITWGTYPNNIGHMDFPGCFRCHDEAHKNKEGKTIPQLCTTCHEIQ
jgi:hypothetical protein